MYKSKLQELCQRKSWNLPEYQTTREGPDHNPRFTSTITVNNHTFNTPTPSRNAKEAQNSVAQLAFHHFSQPPSPSPSPSPSPAPAPAPTTPVPLPQPPSRPGFSFAPPLLPGLDPFPQPTLPGLSSFPQPSFSALSTTASSSCSPSGPSTEVNGILPTSKVLQQKSEEACQTSQISSPVTAAGDIMTAGDQKNMYKNQLQNYAQKRNLNLPAYSSEWEGPPHAMRFKCKVTIDGKTYESPKFFCTLKDAEHAAAEVALKSLSPGGVQEDHTGLFKNLLQELVQKEGLRLPSYSTNKLVEAHAPIFVSNVEIEGEVFSGQEAKSKKQAEMSAAKVAYTILKEREGKSDKRSLLPLSAHQEQAPVVSSDRSDSNVVIGLQHHANPKSPVSPALAPQNQPDKDKVPIVTVKKGSSSSGNKNGSTEDSSLSNGQSAPSLSDSTNVVSDTSNVPSTTVGTPSPRKKVIIYSRNTNVKIEEGGTILPHSDDKWVAYSYSHLDN